MNLVKSYVVFLLLLAECASMKLQARDYLALTKVNTLMGTMSNFTLSNGNTYPAIALPWGMNFWTPQTGKMGDGWCYSYDAYKIRGFKQTHQPSPWINDYGAFSLMPVTGDLKIDEEDRASWFSHKTELARPDYYKVYLADYDVTTEIAPTDRSAYFRFTFPQREHSYIILDGFDKGSMVKIIPSKRKIIGYCRNNNGGVPANFKNYFVAVFDKDFDTSETFLSGKPKIENEAEGDHAIAVVGFKTYKGEQIHVKVASSFISAEQAELNLNREIGNKTFSEVQHSAAYIWENELSKIKVEGNDPKQISTFYSCLYRMLLFPRSFYEYDKDNKIVHYSPYNGKICDGYMYTDNGFWDTFRAVFPFFTLFYPELDSQIMQGIENTYIESGWLPEWASPGHRECMIGSNSASIIADAYLKGIRGFNIDTLYNAILKNTNGYNPNIKSVGRYGADYYNRLGYIPYDVNIKENTARTLEYAYDDYCIWRLAKKLNRPTQEIDLFAKRMKNYINVFDKETGLMRGRNLDGSFQSPFNPLKWGDAFTEGNSLHYTWSVFHDIQGLINLMGGKEKFIAALDHVFDMEPSFDFSYYGFVIHEIREMQIVGMGNYAHGNQPIQHMLYLYNYAGEPWKGQKHLREVMDKLYSATPDGYCGDEDNGQTSAWYVFSALGFYPVCPGSDQYVIGSPLFNKVTIRFENGKTLMLKAPENNKENIFIHSLKFNGKKYNKNWFSHDDLRNGGEVIFRMSATPDKTFGTNPSCFPYSVSAD